MNSPKVFINKVPIILKSCTNISEDNDNIQPFQFVVKTEWSSNGITLNFVDLNERKQFTGTISKDNLEQSAKELELPFEKFYEKCEEALTTNNGLENFQYILDEAQNKFHLIKREKFNIHYIEIKLENSDTELAALILDSAVELLNTMRKECLQAKKMKVEYQDILDALNGCVAEKNDLEKNLLQKFAVLINSKKNKIVELKELLNEKNAKLKELDSKESKHKKNLLERNDNPKTNSDNTNSDDEYTLPTQPLTIPTANVHLPPKRVKKNDVEDMIVEEVRVPSASGSNLNVTASYSGSSPANSEGVNSQNLLEQI